MEDSEGRHPWWLEIRTIPGEGESWYCTMCNKQASEEHLKGKQHTNRVLWGAQPSGAAAAQRTQELAAASGGASSGSQGSPTAATVQFPTQAQGLTAAAQSDIGVHRGMEAMESSLEAVTRMADNCRVALEGLTAVSTQLTAQFEDLREAIQHMHLGIQDGWDPWEAQQERRTS